MNPVNATSLFVSATRSVLQCDPRDPRALAELCKLLPFFRQSLSCLVCGNLLQDPIAPTDSSCQHYVCLGCKGQRMQLKPSCSWCKDYSRFEENRQLSLLVHCYRKLCLYIAQSPLAPHVAAAATDSPDLQAVLDEGLTLAENEPDAQDETDSPTHVTSRSEMTQACLDCICRGCQNSYMANGEKKLEAFAVPEKALEQTRLTLGINLTSITAAALRSPTTASPGNALLNVTTATGAPVTAAFLSGAGHDNRAFDDSLEMRFDC